MWQLTTLEFRSSDLDREMPCTEWWIKLWVSLRLEGLEIEKRKGKKLVKDSV